MLCNTICFYLILSYIILSYLVLPYLIHPIPSYPIICCFLNRIYFHLILLTLPNWSSAGKVFNNPFAQWTRVPPESVGVMSHPR